MLDPATARLCVWRLPLEAAFRLFSKLGSLGGSIRERFSRTGRTRPALARPAFSRWLLENDRLRERWPCQWLNVLYFPFSETSPRVGVRGRGRIPGESHPAFRFKPASHSDAKSAADWLAAFRAETASMPRFQPIPSLFQGAASRVRCAGLRPPLTLPPHGGTPRNGW